MAPPDVIVAVATAPTRAAIGIVRLSGAELRSYMQPLFGRVIPARQAVVVDFHDAAGNPIDNGIALYFPAPRSYTGEDVLELQGHGGVAVTQLVLRRCLELGARLAEPGEFSRRAFLNDKLDLAQAESVADLIEANSEAAVRAAVRSLRGEFSSAIQRLQAEMVELRSYVEALIDFPEEELDLDQSEEVRGRLDSVRERVRDITQVARAGSVLREGVNVVLAGKPNAGKSSLLNRLGGEDIAIVTDVPGTTRDPVRAEISLDGVPVRLIDTAGLREAADLVERIGVDRAWDAIEKADVVVIVVDACEADAPQTDIVHRIPSSAKTIVAVNKIDLIGWEPAKRDVDGHVEVNLSAKFGSGIDLLKAAILDSAGWAPPEEGLFLARERHVDAMQRAAAHVGRADRTGGQLDILAEELRLGHLALSEITGEFTSNDLLGVIFSKFCIGK